MTVVFKINQNLIILDFNYKEFWLLVLGLIMVTLVVFWIFSLYIVFYSWNQRVDYGWRLNLELTMIEVEITNIWTTFSEHRETSSCFQDLQANERKKARTGKRRKKEGKRRELARQKQLTITLLRLKDDLLMQQLR